MTTTSGRHGVFALITGANRGLGLATARLLGQRGATVIIGARNVAKAEIAAAKLRDEGIAAWPLAIDVESEESVAAAATRVEHAHGRLDVLVNNAGILPEATAYAAESPLDLKLFRQTFNTNVFGAVSVSQAFMPLLQLSESGHIVNVSSTMGSLSDQVDPASPYFDVVRPAYQSSKAALNGLTIALSKALADTSVRVNSVCPGWVQTDLGGPENRAAAPTTADDAAQFIVDLALSGTEGPDRTFQDRNGVIAW